VRWTHHHIWRELASVLSFNWDRGAPATWGVTEGAAVLPAVLDVNQVSEG
jgi:hypothetical protein